MIDQKEQVKKERLKEKIQIAREIGMDNWASKRDLLMDFKPITHSEIRKRLGHGNLIFKPHLNLESTMIPMAFLFASIIPMRSKPPLSKEVFLGCIIIMALSLIACLLCNLFSRIYIDDEKLINWTDNIPYGGMLAVKEAKEKGLENFTIFFPVVSYSQRLKTDPIIVGLKNSVIYEVFYWDDGKIYE